MPLHAMTFRPQPKFQAKENVERRTDNFCLTFDHKISTSLSLTINIIILFMSTLKTVKTKENG